MKKYLKKLFNRFIRQQSTQKALESYCEKHPWAPSCRIYEE